MELPDPKDVDPIALIYTTRIDEARERACLAYFNRKRCNLKQFFASRNNLYKRIIMKTGPVVYDNVLYYCEGNTCTVFDGVVVKFSRLKIDNAVNRVYLSNIGGAIFVYIPEHMRVSAVFTSYIRDFSFIDEIIELYKRDVEKTVALKEIVINQ